MRTTVSLADGLFVVLLVTIPVIEAPCAEMTREIIAKAIAPKEFENILIVDLQLSVLHCGSVCCAGCAKCYTRCPKKVRRRRSTRKDPYEIIRQFPCLRFCFEENTAVTKLYWNRINTTSILREAIWSAMRLALRSLRRLNSPRR